MYLQRSSIKPKSGFRQSLLKLLIHSFSTPVGIIHNFCRFGSGQNLKIIDWVSVILLVLLGLLLIVVELIFMPGTTVAGIAGAIILMFGVYLSFSWFGRDVGLLTLGGASFTTVILLVYAFKAGTWKKFALKGSNTGKVNEGLLEHLKEGDTGVATSALRPMGKAEFKDQEYEVSTNGFYAEPGTEIRVVKIDSSNKIIVESLNQ